MRKLIINLCLLSSIFLIWGADKVYALDTHYSVEAILPNNQVDKSVSYFSLKMKPEQKQELNILIHNNGKKEIEVAVEPHNAGTNDNGIIIYNKEFKVDPSMKIPFTSIVSSKKVIHLKPSENKIVSFRLSMPKKKFDGMILGGFRIFENDTKGIDTSKVVQIRNKVEYEISVKLVETKSKVKPNINLVDAFPGLDNYKTTAFMKLQNNTPTVIDNLSVQAKIFKENGNKVIYERNKKNMKMAPNSNFKFPVYLKNEKIKPGNYIAKVSAKSNESRWELEKKFTVKKDQASKYNEKAMNVEKNTKGSIQIYVLAALITVIVLLIIIILKLKKSK